MSSSERPARAYEPLFPRYPSFLQVNKEAFPLSSGSRGIVITGDVCSGSTTLANVLHKKLGLPHSPYLVGEVIRDKSRMLGVSWDALPREELMALYAGTVERIVSDNNFIVEGRFVGEQARGVCGVTKILCTVHPQEALARYMARKGITDYQQGMSALIERKRSDGESLSRVYGRTSLGELFDRNLFDLVVDTTHCFPEEIASQIEDLFLMGA